MARPRKTETRGRTVIVTGASSGIGLATALHLAAAGFHTVATVRSESGEEALRRQAEASGTEIDIRHLDVRDGDGCAALVGSLTSLYGVVNNAGVPAVTAIEDASDDAAMEALEVMAVAPLRFARLALPLLTASQGRVVQISSMAGLAPLPLSGWYGAAKHALRSATDSYRMEVADLGISVTSIYPGMVRTRMWTEPDHSGSRYRSSYDRLWAINRFAARHVIKEPEDVAGAVESVLTTRRPPRSVVLGSDAHVMKGLCSVLPQPLRDRLFRRAYGL